MFPKYLRAIALTCLLLAATAFALAAQAGEQDSLQAENARPRRRIDPPPKDFPFFEYDGIAYASGLVVIENDKDTTLLKEFGFCDFNFRREDSTGVRYDAMWPKGLPWDSLPQQLKWVVYAEFGSAKEQFNISADSIKATNAAENARPRRRIEPPPRNYPSQKYPDGVVYVDGWVVLESDQDTTLLKEFGFREFYFWGRYSTSVQYLARWPKELPWDSLPPQLKGLRYQEHFPKANLNISADSIRAEEPKHNFPDVTQ
jgi:hypothetical protein